MEKAEIQKALKEVNAQPKRKFVQSYELIINLKNINLKQTSVDFSATLHHTTGRKVKVCAFVDNALFDQATKSCDKVIRDTEFALYQQDKKLAKQLAQEFDYFVAQSTLMAKVAAAFGKALGTRGKMPNPKMGCVVPPNSAMEPLIKRLNTTVRFVAKKGMNLQVPIGKENQSEEEVIDNIFTAVQTAIKSLPNESQNIRNVLLKPTMGKPVRI